MSNKINQAKKIVSDLEKSHLKMLLTSLYSILKIIHLFLELIYILFI